MFLFASSGVNEHVGNESNNYTTTIVRFTSEDSWRDAREKKNVRKCDAIEEEPKMVDY